MNRAVLPLAGTVVGLVAVLSYRTPPTALLHAAVPPAAAGTRTLTGQVVQTRWGPVQVAVALAGDRISGVQVLQEPSGNRRDQEIGAYAFPRLVQETLQAQSAQVDTVSGATYTSQGYLASLQSALDQR